MVETVTDKISVYNAMRVTSSLFETSDGNDVIMDFKNRLNGKLKAVVDNNPSINDSPSPLLTLAQSVQDNFVVDLSVTGEEYIPKTGPVIIAGNHQFSFVDVFTFVNRFIKTVEDRPWRVVANIRMFTKLFPNWENDERMLRHFIPVRRSDLADSKSRATNGDEVVSTAVQFLLCENDPVLFLCPEGPAGNYLNNIARPHMGLAKISRASNAQIVPVTVLGSVDKDRLQFSLRVRVNPPFHPSVNDEDTLKEWSHRLAEGGEKFVDSFEAGLDRAVANIQGLLETKSSILIDIEGKVGAGKTTFACRLQERLNMAGVSCTIVKKDKYRQNATTTPANRTHDVTAMEADIEKAMPTASVVIVEGLIPLGVATHSKKTDYKIFVESPQIERISRRIVRNEALGKRTIVESLQEIVDFATKDVGDLDNYERKRPDFDTDLIVYNDFRQPCSPNVFIQNNELVFMVDGVIKGKIKLDDEGQITKALKKMNLL
ncbi:1-acyl-sn-glycerol-3-phosphate acyltransferase [Candidatus Gracilibacteria bacterium]|nr:1-acyl-sn-glycerol-3-phosphate acyltransferase [Candidatus Gracilibacteria bacterium]